MHDLCKLPGAVKSVNGMSVVPADVVRLITRDPSHWDQTEQYLRVCGPLVDAIGNLESRDVTLGD